MINVDGSTSFVIGLTPPPAPHVATEVSPAACALLEDYGRNIGIPLRFGDDNGCWLRLGEQNIACISASPDGASLRVHAEICPLPAENEVPDLAPYFRSLLEKNFEALTTGEELAFAIDPRRNALTLTADLPENATPQQTLDLMEQLQTQVERFQSNPPAVDAHLYTDVASESMPKVPSGLGFMTASALHPNELVFIV